MKKHRTSFILLGLLVSVLFIGFFSSVGVASSDIDYTFQNDNLFNSTGLGRQSWVDNASQTFNIRQRENITNIFNATYSYTEEIEFTTGIDIDFVDSTNSDNDVEIINSIGNHDKVIRTFRNTGNGWFIHNFDSDISSGIAEGYFQVSDSGASNQFFILRENNLDRLMVRIGAGEFQYRLIGVGWTNIGKLGFDNVWYHVKVEWFGDDTFDLWINGIQYLDGATTWAVMVDGYDAYELLQASVGINYIYIDAFGYSWDPYYSIGDNIFPLTEVYSEQYEVDKWEFRHNPLTRTQYVDGTADPSGWNTDVNAETLNIGGSRNIVIHVDDDGDVERNFGGLDDTYYNISYNFGINQLDDDDIGANAIVLKIDDEEADVIVSVYIRINDNVEIFHDAGSTVLGSITLVANFTATFLINFESQVFNFILSDWNDGTIFFDFFGGFYSNSATDIRKIDYIHICTGTDIVDSDLFSISMYNTTGSISDDVGELRWDEVGFPEPIWTFTEFNLISLESNFQNFSLFHEAFGGISFKNFIYWNSENINFVNIYEDDSLSTAITSLRLWMYNNFSFSSISIDGVKLNEGLNSHPLIYNSGSVDGNNSYFYVSGDRLNFNLITNDNNLEYIQASFNIDNLITENYSVSFRSDVFGASSCNLRLSYTDSTSSFIEFPTYATHTSIILPQEKEIGEVIVLITDNDLLNEGSTTGYIRSISFINFRDITTTIITLSLLTVIIPLIVLLIPTFAMYGKFGKSAIIPMFLLMSIVCFATNLIPVWLFFLIIVASGGIIVSQKARGDF